MTSKPKKDKKRVKDRKLENDWLVINDDMHKPVTPIPTPIQYSLFSNFQSAFQKASTVRTNIIPTNNVISNPISNGNGTAAARPPPSPHPLLSLFPTNAVDYLLKFLSIFDIISISSTSRWSKIYFLSDLFWERLFEKEYGRRRKEDLFEFVSKFENKLSQAYVLRYANEYLRECPLQGRKQCARCKKSFSDVLNNDSACVYHTGQLNSEGGRTYYNCCTSTTSNGTEMGKNFWLIGHLNHPPTQQQLQQTNNNNVITSNQQPTTFVTEKSRFHAKIIKLMSNFTWNIWISDEEAEKQARRQEVTTSQPIQLVDGTTVWYLPPLFIPKRFDDYYSDGLVFMLLFDLSTEGTARESLNVLLEVYERWKRKHGLCLHTNVPIIVGVSQVDPPSIVPPPDLLQTVMETWNCNRYMVIVIGSSNSVKRAFLFLANNYIDHLHRGCSIGRHVHEIPVGDHFRKLILSVKQ